MYRLGIAVEFRGAIGSAVYLDEARDIGRPPDKGDGCMRHRHEDAISFETTCDGVQNTTAADQKQTISMIERAYLAVLLTKFPPSVGVGMNIL
jgi:hypothetical protein